MKKRVISVLMTLCIMLSLLPRTALATEAADSGQLGDNITWSFEESTGTLTISGSGEMEALEWVWGKEEVTPKAWQFLVLDGKNIRTIIIQDGITSIGENAFACISSLETITIPESVTTIGTLAFVFSGLQAITIPESVTTIGNGAFSSCDNLTNIVIPDSVTELGTSVFNASKNLQSVTLPENLTTIGDSMFRGCSELTDVNIPDGITSIETYAFKGCEKLSNIQIPSGVTEIGSSAFSSCGLTGNLVIPDGVTTIDVQTFMSTHITSVTIPTSVTEIKGGAFFLCRSLTDVYYTGSEEQWDQIDITMGLGGSSNDEIANAAKHFNYTESTPPTPDLPAEPDNPNPEEPVTPTPPEEQPTLPVYPAYPDIPTQPSTGKPSTPSTPSTPGNTPVSKEPEEPEEPAVPEPPAEPETPVQPETPVTPAPVYRDVPSTAWYSEAAGYVSARGLMTGATATEFAPEANMTRAMLWMVLGRLDGADVDGGTPWYAKAQAWSQSKGISDGTNPNGSITREELVTMLWRYIGSPSAQAELARFTDSASVSGWATAAIQWAVSVGLLEGSGGSLNPSGAATRAEVATIMMRFCENIL